MQMNNENDFKYFLEDFSTIYIGANYSYEEILQHEIMPIKFREIAARVFVKETGPQVTLAEHLAKVKEGDNSYLIFRQLKAKIKVTQLKKSGKGYQSQYYTFTEFMEEEQQHAALGECTVQEIVIKKLHLVGFAI